MSVLAKLNLLVLMEMSIICIGIEAGTPLVDIEIAISKLSESISLVEKSTKIFILAKNLVQIL